MKKALTAEEDEREVGGRGSGSRLKVTISWLSVFMGRVEEIT